MPRLCSRLATVLVAVTSAAAWLSAAAAARADTITQTYTFSATGFQTNAPYAVVSGSFTLTFDPTVSVSTDATAGLTVNSLTPAILGDTGVGYRNYNIGSTSELFVGGLASGAATVNGNTADDFYVYIVNAQSTTPTFGGLVYATTATGTYGTGTGTVFATPAPTPLPTSATAGLSLLGLLGVAGAVRRRRPAAA